MNQRAVGMTFYQYKYAEKEMRPYSKELAETMVTITLAAPTETFALAAFPLLPVTVCISTPLSDNMNLSESSFVEVETADEKHKSLVLLKFRQNLDYPKKA
jgi:hypothetical protein